MPGSKIGQSPNHRMATYAHCWTPLIESDHVVMMVVVVIVRSPRMLNGEDLSILSNVKKMHNKEKNPQSRKCQGPQRMGLLSTIYCRLLNVQHTYATKKRSMSPTMLETLQAQNTCSQLELRTRCIVHQLCKLVCVKLSIDLVWGWMAWKPN